LSSSLSIQKFRSRRLNFGTKLTGRRCAVLIISHAERQQEAALDALSNYKLKPQPVVYDDPDLKLITARSSEMRDE